MAARKCAMKAITLELPLPKLHKYFSYYCIFTFRQNIELWMTKNSISEFRSGRSCFRLSSMLSQVTFTISTECQKLFMIRCAKYASEYCCTLKLILTLWFVSLFMKFSELRHTQNLIRDSIYTTRATIGRLSTAAAGLMGDTGGSEAARVLSGLSMQQVCLYICDV